MSYYGSRSGSRDNLDDSQQDPPPPQPRQPPTPSQRTYDRQYVRNQPQSESGTGGGAPPAYHQYSDRSRAPAVPAPRYGERPGPRGHSPHRYLEERPQDEFYPSRSHSPSSFVGARAESPARYAYDERSAPRQPVGRSQSPGRALDNGAYSPGYTPPRSTSGYPPPQHSYPPQQHYPSQAGSNQQSYPSPQAVYAPQSGYPPSQGYQPKSRGYSTSSTSGHRGQLPSQTQSSQYYPQKSQGRSYDDYQRDRPPRHGFVYGKPKHKTVTRDGGYYNVYTDAVVKTKKLKSKGVPTTYLAVTRPWSKNHSNQPRDFMPLVIAAIFFNPIIGAVALIVSCITKNAVTRENWAKAGWCGRITFWLSIVAIITGIMIWCALIGALHNHSFPPSHH